MLLGTTTRDMAERNNRVEPELSDVRQALEHVGLIRPLNIYDDPYDADTTGVETLIEWFQGHQAAEIRRVAGFAVPEVGVPGPVGVDGALPGAPGAGAGGGAGAAKNDEWIASLKKITEKRSGA